MSKIDEELNKIAGVHLGKAGDGSAVNPYVTPDTIDASLLVAIPRSLNRTQYGIADDDLNFVGYDVWNCYEVSALLKNGAPVSGALKLRYPANSHSIVESKSLKLYLNSFNMYKFDTNDIVEVSLQISERVCLDLSALLDCPVIAKFYPPSYWGEVGYVDPGASFVTVEDIVDFDKFECNHYNEDPDILNTTVEGRIYYHSSLLRSNCRVTNQPDWGDIFVAMDAKTAPTPESFLQYITSMRKENHFHEEICECVYTRLYEKFNPENLLVFCLYTRRGGIDINPVRSTSYDIIPENDAFSIDRLFKTTRQ